jgi:hypothetical protein
VDLDLRRLAHAKEFVVAEVRRHHAAVRILHLLLERGREPHEDAALHLRLDRIGIDDRAQSTAQVTFTSPVSVTDVAVDKLLENVRVTVVCNGNPNVSSFISNDPTALVIDIMAGIPSVIYGFWGLAFLVPRSGSWR